MSEQRSCLNCSKWKPEFYEETHQELAGFCSKDEKKISLKYESQTCEAHRFKRGTNKEVSS